MYNKPILFIIFNRLDTTKVVFSRIREMQPKQLYVAADGPRNESEKIKCEAVRNYVLSNVDWNCDIKTHFQDKNKGCGHNVSEAITWFFENVEAGIILEDDCLPQECFFEYCSQLLDKYKDDDSIMHITGYNPLGITDINESFYFANIIHCWGWASWRRAWNKYSFEIDKDYKKHLHNVQIFKSFPVRNYWYFTFNRMLKHEVDTWDYQWCYTVLKNNGFCINPSKNMVQNVGMASGAHYQGKKEIEMKVYDIDFPLVLPNVKKIDVKLNKLIQINEYKVIKQLFYIPLKKILHLIGKY